jgi:hypothetical protein
MTAASLFAYVDNYCERTAAGLLNEPLNALTNASFLIAAWMLLALYRAGSQKDREAEGLIACIALVGFGSLTFHTAANTLAMMADVFPIVIFTCYYLWLAFRRLIGWNSLAAFAGVVAFLLIGAKMDSVPPEYSFNGSVAYFPCLAALIAIGWHLRRRRHAAAPLLLKAAGVFTASLTFRSMDMLVCAQLAIGTHFLWHSLNGYVLYLLGRSVMKPAAPQ